LFFTRWRNSAVIELIEMLLATAGKIIRKSWNVSVRMEICFTFGGRLAYIIETGYICSCPIWCESEGMAMAGF
jgi:hypothetical protein